MNSTKLINEALLNFTKNRKVAVHDLRKAKYEYQGHEHGLFCRLGWSSTHALGESIPALSQRVDMYTQSVRGLQGGITTPAVEMLDTVIIPELKEEVDSLVPTDFRNFVIIANPHSMYDHTVELRENLAAVVPKGLKPRQ